MYVVLPDLSEDELAAVMQRTADTVTQIGATVELNEIWERRELAYQIDDWTRGTYCLMYFASEGNVVEALLRELELDEQVLRSAVFVANPNAMWRPVPPGEPDEGAAEEQGAAKESAAEAAEAAPAEPAEESADTEAQPDQENQPDEAESQDE